MIYLDNAATSLKKPDCVTAAVMEAMASLGNCARGVHGKSLTAARTVFAAREKAAAMFGCTKPAHVAFTANATESLNIALFGLFASGDHIISTDLEHNSVLRPLYRLQREHGIRVSFVPADKTGNINYGDFEKLIRPETKAIVTTHASNLTGNLVDIERIGRHAKAHGLIYIVDASQTAGTFPIDMGRQHINVLCWTGHKGLLGPQGTGGICVAENVKIRPFKVGGTGTHSFLETQPENYPEVLEAGTLNGHGIAGLLAAFEYLEKTGIDEIHRYELDLMQRFFAGVRDIPDVTVYSDFSGDRAPIVALNIGDYDSSEVADELTQRYDIAVRAGAHCAPRMHRALGTEKQGAVRFSFGWFNTAEEIDVAIGAVTRMAEK